MWCLTFSCFPKSDVPEYQPEPISDNCSALSVNISGHHATILLPVVDECLDLDLRSESLQVIQVRIPLKVLVILHHISQSTWIDIDSDLLIDYSYPIFILILIWIIWISKRQLNPQRKWVHNIAVWHAHFLREYIFHHFQHHVSFYQFKYTISEIMRLVPDRRGNKHFTHWIPVETNVFYFK